jgi:hypothetical protein
MITSYIIPLMFLIIFSMSTLVRLWKSAPGGKLSAERMKIRKSVTKMVLTVVGVFAVCWGPIQDSVSSHFQETIGGLNVKFASFISHFYDLSLECFIVSLLNISIGYNFEMLLLFTVYDFIVINV